MLNKKMCIVFAILSFLSMFECLLNYKFMSVESNKKLGLSFYSSFLNLIFLNLTYILTKVLVWHGLDILKDQKLVLHHRQLEKHCTRELRREQMLLYLFFICGDSPDPSSIVIFSLQQWVYVKPCTPILLVLSYAYAHDFTRWLPMELVMLSIKNKVKIIKMEIHISLTHLDNKANNKRVN